jgi:hypothetical protein
MDSFPFKEDFGASMENSINLDDKNLDDEIDGDFFPFEDLEEAINDDFFLFFAGSMTIIFVSLSSTCESWTPATFNCDVDDDFASTNDFAGDTIAAVRPPPPSLVVLNLPFSFNVKEASVNALLPGDFTRGDRCDFFSFLLRVEFTSAALFIVSFCGFVPCS